MEVEISRVEDSEVTWRRQQGALTREVEDIHAAKKRAATPAEAQPPVEEKGEWMEEDEEESGDSGSGGTRSTTIEVREEVVEWRVVPKAV